MLRLSLPRRALHSKVPMHQLYAPPPLPTPPTVVPANEIYMIVRSVKWNAEPEVEVLYDDAGVVNGKEIHAPGTRKTVVDTVVQGTEVERDAEGRALVVKGRFDTARAVFVEEEGGMAGYRTPMAIIELAGERGIKPDESLPATPHTSTHTGLTTKQLKGNPEATFADTLKNDALIARRAPGAATTTRPFYPTPILIKSGNKLVLSNVEPIPKQPHQYAEPIPEEMNWNSASIIPEPVSPIPIAASQINGYDEELGEKLKKSDYFAYLAYRQECAGMPRGTRPVIERALDLDPVAEARRTAKCRELEKRMEIAKAMERDFQFKKDRLRLTSELLDQLIAEDAAEEKERLAKKKLEKKKMVAKAKKHQVGDVL